MRTLEQIKNDYAVNKGYYDFDDLLISVINYEILSEQINEVMKIYTIECLKLASERTSEQYVRPITLNYQEIKDLITNENNIIK